MDKFVKLGEVIFPAEERPFYEHPSVTAAREAEEIKQNGGKKKKKPKKKKEIRH